MAFVELIEAAVDGSEAAETSLAASSRFFRVWKADGALIAVPRNIERPCAFFRCPKARRVVRAPVPTSFAIIGADFDDGIFTLRAADGRDVSSTVSVFGQLDGQFLGGFAAQWTESDLENAFLTLTPNEPRGIGVISQIAGPIKFDERGSNLFSGEMPFEGRTFYLGIYTRSEDRLRAIVASMDRHLANLFQIMADATALLVRKGALETESGTFPFSEMIAYEGGAFDLSGSNAYVKENGLDYISVHFDAAARPLQFSLN